MKLSGKVAIISGSGRGLGRAIAVELARQGASVVIFSRTQTELRETARLIRSVGCRFIQRTADISKPGDIRGVIRETVDVFKRIDILVNNAAVIGPVTPLYDVTTGAWNKAFDINLKGVFLLSRSVVPHMVRQGGGKIINITSGLGEIVMPPFGLYSITKSGLIHMTKIMAEELREYNIQVNGLDPGVADTKMQGDIRSLGPKVLGEAVYRQFMALKEKRSLSSPEKIAHLAVFLASEGSDLITGQNGTELFYRNHGYEG